MSATATGTCQHGPYHECACYKHDTELPNYRRDVANPRTLQGYYAPNGGCPCPAGYGSDASKNLPESATPTEGNAKPKETFRAADGPHTVHTASASASFPNSRNYGGTVAQRGPAASVVAAIAFSNSATGEPNMTRSAKKQAKVEERAQDRKNFLKAVLRDEMLARMDAEGRRAELEGDTELMGTNHIDEYEASQRAAGKGQPLSPASRMASRGPREVATVGEQYGEIMDELEFVAGRPVGSKYNIIRLHYLVEEERRLNDLRRQERQQKSAIAFAAKQKK
ncbi:putative mitochondrial hypothetical protein [Leptomonas pyrrhocoris]|uniref:Uncharacterized protein n=1 Tax=Leptomonas pyrrhocoris TaxID=157538 RepID=A0A0M9FYS7_LEPPY|nr:putative mitochondrial hypothetical protein [Leptomonas pyrrhocoris]XP_015657293.1 putative mitochondrial hypothetical protein [Leptomonas pyrrhocoris]XP_015657294.1 putative mitochondrial hypothetical protein [Leptomonas pyrrhocoris]XP_015657295.1 putative mitochondrial hypothetical protein [Leptomonas pyrrhocoris]KPA78853.1 putative mitochondrial hypothetical protein [Leptomonas pyrrhocoris]KPA78854.1 putative mitochondrial hypothetical protein [Leptomonas pyrrhocoris]KPA78855.1 putative|eukprot:XP_015657292.1 putative mitochondrial hypothetical protein [Leptomonas pyrrhocoris]